MAEAGVGARAGAKAMDGLVAGGKKDGGAGSKDCGDGAGDGAADSSEGEVYVSPGTLRTLLGKVRPKVTTIFLESCR